jgi:hypothetical protein
MSKTVASGWKRPALRDALSADCLLLWDKGADMSQCALKKMILFIAPEYG